MKKRTMILGGLVLIALTAVIARKLTKKEQFAPGLEDPVVQVVNPDRGNISNETALIGSVEPDDVVYVYAKAGGDVTAVSVKAGDTVKAGDPILTIDTKQVTSAENTMNSAKLSLQKAEADLSRNQVLYNAAGISAQEYESYANAVSQAKIAWESAKTNYETQLEYSSVTASIDGTVELMDAEIHDSVNAGTLLCVISGEGERIVSFSVTERIREALNVGDRIRIEKDGKEYSGTISEISSMADTSTGLFKVKAGLDDGAAQDSALPTGSMVKLYVTSSHTENALRVPVDSVYYSGGASVVYTCDADGTVHKTDVETGISNDDYVEILVGITENDRVISTWSSELDEGTHVRVLGEADAGAGGQAENGGAETSAAENDSGATAAAAGAAPGPQTK